MSRRSTPERLDATRRAATLARLVSGGLLPEQAEAALAAWARSQAGRARDAAYWDDAHARITGRAQS